MDNSVLYSGYEKRILSNKKKTNADLIKDDQMLRNTFRECLGMEFKTELEDGTVIDVPLIKLLTAKKIAYLMDNPKEIDLKELSSVLGENKVEQQITFRGADELFGDIAIKDETK